MGLFNKIWSGLDFWQGDENRQQRQQFKQEEDEREREKQWRTSVHKYQRENPETAFQQIESTQQPQPQTQADYSGTGANVGQEVNYVPQEITDEVRQAEIDKIEKPKQSFGNKFRDIFDANTDADKYRREVGNVDTYVREINTGEEQNYKDVDQQDSGNLISNTVGAVPRAFNTAANQIVEVGYTAQQEFAGNEYSAAVSELTEAVASGNSERIAAANERVNNAADRVSDINRQIGITKEGYGDTGGLFNAGTIYNEEDSHKGDLGTGIRKIGGNTLEGMFDVASFGLTGLTAKQVAAQGFKNTLKANKGIIFKNTLANAGQGGSSSYRQGGDAGDIATSAFIGGTAGTGADLLLAGTGGNLLKKFGSQADDVAQLATTATGKATKNVASETPIIPGIKPKTKTVPNFLPDDGSPSYVRKVPQTVGEAQDQARLATVNDEVFDADARLVRNTEPVDAIDRPAFQHRDDMDALLAKANDDLNRWRLAHPDATQAELAMVNKRIAQQVSQAIASLEDARYGSLSTPNIPDPTSPVTLAKATGAEVPKSVQPAGIVGDFGDEALDGSNLRKVASGGNATDELGNPVLKSDKQLAREMQEAGLTPSRGNSPVQAAEDARQSAVAKAAKDEVSQAEPTVVFNDPELGPRRVTQRQLAVDIGDLEASGGRLGRDNVAKLDQLKKAYRNFEENAELATDRGAKSFGDSLDQARAARSKDRELISQQRGERIAAGDEAYDKVFAETGDAQQAIKAKKAALRGPMERGDRFVVEADVQTQNRIMQELQSAPTGKRYDVANTQTAFQKIWGNLDEPLVDSDIRNLQKYWNTKEAGFGDEVAKQIKEAITDNPGLVTKIASAPRTMMTIADFSSPRQGAALMARHPVIGTKSYLNSIRNFFQKGNYEKGVDDLTKMTDRNGVNYLDFMQDDMGLNLPNLGGQAEEAFSAGASLSKVPAYGRLVKASDRSFSSALGDLRFHSAKQWIDAEGGIDAVRKKYSTGQGRYLSIKGMKERQNAIKQMGEMLNTMSGRGGMDKGWVDNNAKLLSDTLFSGRLWASRLNMLNPHWYYRLSGPARREAIQSAASFATLAGTTLTLLNQIDGVEVGVDPRSADFAKVKVGNTRYDILGGLQQNIRVAAQIITGQKINSSTGEVQSVEDDGPYAPTRPGFALDFLDNKANPLIAWGLDLAESTDDGDGNWMTRENEYGEQFNMLERTGELGLPLSVSGIGDQIEYEGGNVPLALLKTAPEFFGAGVQTYGDNPNVAPKTTSQINRAAENGEFDRAIEGYRNQLESELSGKNPDSGKVAELEADIRDLQYEKLGAPKDSDGILMHMEQGNWDMAIAGEQWALDKAADDGEISQKTRDNHENKIKAYKIYADLKPDYELVKAYENGTASTGGVGVTDWRDMMDSGNASLIEMANELAEIDKAMYDAGIIDKPKYYWKNGKAGGGRSGGGGSGGKSKGISTSIKGYTAPTPVKSFTKKSATFGRQSQLPTIPGVPANDPSMLKKITVKRGGR